MLKLNGLNPLNALSGPFHTPVPSSNSMPKRPRHVAPSRMPFATALPLLLGEQSPSASKEITPADVPASSACVLPNLVLPTQLAIEAPTQVVAFPDLTPPASTAAPSGLVIVDTSAVLKLPFSTVQYGDENALPAAVEVPAPRIPDILDDRASLTFLDSGALDPAASVAECRRVRKRARNYTGSPNQGIFTVATSCNPARLVPPKPCGWGWCTDITMT
ncbi:hypothetical protein WJX74_006689 [Apatococcus lobatus]|uniref:Uncharacterized protein n=1 Tax=Apatococcus lobatus TaxID=904363 RepID=A0AAW1SF19_9CHLO